MQLVIVRFYRTVAGASPVEKYLEGLDAKERAAVLESLQNVQERGLSASGVVTRHIRDKLWEIKASSQRVFYVVITGPTMVILHAYKKQGQKAPAQEIAVAERRMRDVLAGS